MFEMHISYLVFAVHRNVDFTGFFYWCKCLEPVQKSNLLLLLLLLNISLMEVNKIPSQDSNPVTSTFK